MILSKNSFLDRSIKPGHTPSEAMITLKVLKEHTIKGVVFTVGETFKVNKLIARQMIQIDRALYRAVLD